MSRPSITMPPSRPSARWRATNSCPHRRQSRHRRHRADRCRGVRIAPVTSTPSTRDLTVATTMSARLGQRADRGLVFEIDAPVDDAATPSRDTSRRCPRGDTRAPSAIARATVPLPTPDGPSMAITFRMRRCSVTNRPSVAQGFGAANVRARLQRWQRPGRPEGLRYYLSRMRRSRSRPTLIAVLLTLLTIGLVWGPSYAPRPLARRTGGAPGRVDRTRGGFGRARLARGTRDDDPDASRPHSRAAVSPRGQDPPRRGS